MPTTLIPFEDTGWKYVSYVGESATLPTNWEKPSFDDSAWSTGQAAFGALNGFSNPVFLAFIGSSIRTNVGDDRAGAAGGVILFRKTVTMVGDSQLQVSLRPDNYGSLYINGNLALSTGGWTTGHIGWEVSSGAGDPALEFELSVAPGPVFSWTPSSLTTPRAYANGESLLIACAVWNQVETSSPNPIYADVQVIVP